MCDFGIALGLASAAVGAAGSIQQAQAAAAAANFNAQVNEMNAQITDERAQDALERGQKEEQKKRREVAQIKGKQLAALSANGIDVGFGSALSTQIDTDFLGELDAQTIRTNAARENYDLRLQAVNQRAGAQLNRAEASSVLTGGFLQAGGRFLKGTSNAIGQIN